MKETALKLADVRSCARQHPWLVTGSAVAAGFVAGTVLTHAPPKQVRPTEADSESQGEPGDREKEPPRTATVSWSSTVGTAATAAVMTMLQGALTAAAVSLFAGDEASGETAPSDAAPQQGDSESGTD